MSDAALVVAFAMPQFVDALVAGAVEVAREQLRSLDVGAVGNVLTNGLVQKFAVGGGGALGLFMVGRYMRKAEFIIKFLSTGGAFLMLLGALSLVGVVDLNLSRIAQALGGVL